MITAKYIIATIALITAVLLFSGCSEDTTINGNVTDGGSTGPITTEGLLQSTQQRNTSPEVSASEVEKLVAGANTFAITLFGKMNASSVGNLFISPYSISSALTMSYAGARNRTADEMAAVLSLSLPDEKVFASYNYLDINLQNTKIDSGSFTLKIANAVWGQTGYSFQNSYLDLLAQNYSAGLRLLDFSKCEQSRETINSWVEEATENRIKDLLPPGSINGYTRLVLTNAIYFLAEWINQFEDKKTYDAAFYRSAVDSTPVPTMHQTKTFMFAEDDGCKAIRLPYKGDRMSMIIILPESAIDEFTTTLTVNKIKNIESIMTNATVDLSMPKFEFTFSASLKTPLNEMGMHQAFTPSADFSGITGYKDLYISDAFHKAFIKVDEKKTEAAAATGVVVVTMGITIIDNQMKIDRPFLFIIKDEITGAYLFMGKVVDPEVS